MNDNSEATLTRLYGPRGSRPWDKKRKPQTQECLHCGRQFRVSAISSIVAYCSNACRRLAHSKKGKTHEESTAT